MIDTTIPLFPSFLWCPLLFWKFYVGSSLIFNTLPTRCPPLCQINYGKPLVASGSVAFGFEAFGLVASGSAASGSTASRLVTFQFDCASWWFWVRCWLLWWFCHSWMCGIRLCHDGFGGSGFWDIRFSGVRLSGIWVWQLSGSNSIRYIVPMLLKPPVSPKTA